MNLEQKIRVALNLPEADFDIRAEARIADEQLRHENERHAQALRDIEERLNLEAWQFIEKSWTPEEIKQVNG